MNIWPYGTHSGAFVSYSGGKEKGPRYSTSLLVSSDFNSLIIDLIWLKERRLVSFDVSFNTVAAFYDDEIFAEGRRVNTVWHRLYVPSARSSSSRGPPLFWWWICPDNEISTRCYLNISIDWRGGPIGARTHSAVADWNGARPAGQSIDSVDRWWRLDWISQRDCVVLQEKARALAAAAALINGGRCNFILDRTQLSLGRPKIRRTKTHTQNRVPSSW